MTDSTYRLTEIVGTSSTSIDDAITSGIGKAAQTLHNLDWFEVTEIRGALSDAAVDQFQVTLKVGFRVD